MQTNAVLSVLGKDRAGIVATVSATLYKCGANIDDIRQTILNDIFTMTMLITIDEDKCPFVTIQDLLSKDGDELGLQIRLQRKDVFDCMYKI